jgi:hypothetical protein
MSKAGWPEHSKAQFFGRGLAIGGTLAYFHWARIERSATPCHSLLIPDLDSYRLRRPTLKFVRTDLFLLGKRLHFFQRQLWKEHFSLADQMLDVFRGRLCHRVESEFVFGYSELLRCRRRSLQYIWRCT